MHLLFTGILALALVSVIAISGCGQSGCTTDKQCKAWQSCDVGKKVCVLQYGYCNVDADCNDTLKLCGTQDHMCTYITDRCRSDIDCEGWQLCDKEATTCRPKAGFCSSDSMCNQDTQVCSPTRHVCSPKPGTCNNQYDCDAWQTCNRGGASPTPGPRRCNG